MRNLIESIKLPESIKQKFIYFNSTIQSTYVKRKEFKLFNKN
jgi:hypothetical protein